jgi:hypothetical protein
MSRWATLLGPVLAAGPATMAAIFAVLLALGLAAASAVRRRRSSVDQ